MTFGFAVFTVVFELAFQLAFSFSIESAIILTAFSAFFASEIDCWMERKKLNKGGAETRESEIKESKNEELIPEQI